MIALSTSKLSLFIGTKPIIENVTFAIEEGDRLGIVGVNGSGKSTLLRLICGEYSATSGDVYISSDKAVGMMEQDDAFRLPDDADADSLTVISQMYAAVPALQSAERRLAELEAAMTRLSGDELTHAASEYSRLNTRFIDDGGLHYKSRCKSLLMRLGFDESMHTLPVTSLSGGQRTRLALARLLFREPDILILDEPTNHLDTDTRVWLENHLASYKKTLIVVSHDRYFLDRVTNKTLDIENHNATLYRVPYSKYAEQKKCNREIAEKHYQLQQREIARLEAYIKQQRQWNRERNIIAAESREKAIARMEMVERPEDLPKSIGFRFAQSGESGNDVLSVKGLGMEFPGKTLFNDLSFEVKKREHVFIAGANGCGKSTLLKILLDRITPTSGKFEFGYNVHIGYYDQENQNLSPEKTVLDELWDAYPDTNQTTLRTTLARFMFRSDDVSKPVSVLSGGERARLTLAKLMLSRVNVLILDEPTNHLDIQSREALEDALEVFDGTLIAVSHDRYFLKKLATRIIDISRGGADIPGGFDDYTAFLERTNAEVESAADDDGSDAKSSSKEQYLQRKRDEAAHRAAEKRKIRVAERTAEVEAEIEKLNARLYGEAASDYVLAAELQEKLDLLEAELLKLYEQAMQDNN